MTSDPSSPGQSGDQERDEFELFLEELESEADAPAWPRTTGFGLPDQ